MSDKYDCEIGDLVMIKKTGEGVLVTKCWENAEKFEVKFQDGRKKVFKAGELKFCK